MKNSKTEFAALPDGCRFCMICILRLCKHLVLFRAKDVLNSCFLTLSLSGVDKCGEVKVRSMHMTTFKGSNMRGTSSSKDVEDGY